MLPAPWFQCRDLSPLRGTGPFFSVPTMHHFRPNGCLLLWSFPESDEELVLRQRGWSPGPRRRAGGGTRSCCRGPAAPPGTPRGPPSPGGHPRVHGGPRQTLNQLLGQTPHSGRSLGGGRRREVRGGGGASERSDARVHVGLRLLLLQKEVGEAAADGGAQGGVGGVGGGGRCGDAALGGGAGAAAASWSLDSSSSSIIIMELLQDRVAEQPVG